MTDPHDAAYAVQEAAHAVGSYGLSKRELFAAMAMQGLLSDEGNGMEGVTAEDVAVAAIKFADALIEALNK